jgi:hypothetical protein
MLLRSKNIILLFFFIACRFISYSQQLLTDSRHHYQLTLPDSLIEMRDEGNDSDRTFYDNTSGVVLLITAREGIYANPEGYINCSKKNLETELKNYQGDSTLKLISCEKAPIYPNDVIKLHFETKILPQGFNRCVIYFVHHAREDIQFSFMYDKAYETKSMTYIERVIQTLKLP